MSIRKKIILILTTIAIVPMLFVGILGYTSAKQALSDAKISALASICDLKVRKIEDFFKEKEKEISALQAYPEIKRAVQLFSQDASDQNQATEILDAMLFDLQGVYHFTNASITAPDGLILYAITDSQSVAGRSPPFPAQSAEIHPDQKTALWISEVYPTGQDCNPVAIQVTAPIYGANSALLGWLSLEYDFTLIYDSIQDVTGLGRTGEILIAKKKNGHSALFFVPFPK